MKDKRNIGARATAAHSGIGQAVIGGGTAVLRGKKPSLVTSDAADGIITDPLGSWTGVPVDDPYEKPIQDADDL